MLMMWMVLRVFKKKQPFWTFHLLWWYPNHGSLVLNVCKQCAWVSNSGSLNTSVCGKAGRTPFTTNQNDCLSWRCIFQNLRSKSPWQSFSGFPFSLHKTGIWRMFCRYVGSKRVQRGSTKRNRWSDRWGVQSTMVSSQHSDGQFILLRCCASTFRYKEERVMSEHRSQRWTGSICTGSQAAGHFHANLKNWSV